VGLLRRALSVATAVIPAFAASQGRIGTAARGLQTGLELAAPFLGGASASVVAAPGGSMRLGSPGVMKIGGGVFGPGGITSPIPSMGATESQQVKMVLSLAGQALDLRNRKGEPRPMRRREFLGLVRAVGIHEAAEIMQQSSGTVAIVAMILRRKRARGISARDVRMVRKAVRTVKRARRLSAAFGRGGGGAAPRRRARAHGHALTPGGQIVSVR